MQHVAWSPIVNFEEAVKWIKIYLYGIPKVVNH
jgi:hypothetical protein